MGVEKIHLQFWNAQTFLYLFYLTDYALKLILVGPILCFIKVKAFNTSWPYLWTYFWCFYSFGIRRASQTTLYKIGLALRPLLMTLRIFLLTLSYQSYSINGASKGYSTKQKKNNFSAMHGSRKDPFTVLECSDLPLSFLFNWLCSKINFSGTDSLFY